MDEVFTQMEPEATEGFLGWQAITACSIAISLKRIADALETTDHHKRPVKLMDVLTGIEMNGRR